MKKSNVKKTVILVVAFILVVVCAVGGTLAWLQDETSAVKNTFTTAEVDIDLTEPEGEKNDYEFKMTPGATIDKDPTVTVNADSENAYVFVKVEKSNNFDAFLTYEIAEGWTLVDDTENVYYRTYTSKATDVDYAVLKNDQVTVKNTVTSDDMDDLTDETFPTLTFTAYAVQMANGDSTFTVEQAWNIAKGLDPNYDPFAGGSN